MHKYKTHVKTKPRKMAEETVAILLQEIFADQPGPALIAIGGPGGTGKSSFCRRLSALLPGSAIFRLDDYKTARQVRRDQNLYGAHPDANKMELIATHFNLIKNNTPFDKPLYDNQTGSDSATELYTPARYNLLDGEISTYRSFREAVDFSIFIDSDWKTQLQTRISRDIEVRGYTRDKAIATFLQSNLREFEKYGAESKKWADVHLYCHDDYSLVVESVSAQMFERFQTLLQESLDPVDLSGLIVPVLTPFSEDGSIDQEMLIAHFEFLAEAGVKRVLVSGTTGEFFSLTPSERKLTLQLARRYFPGVVFFQAGRDSLAQTRKEVGWARDYGADAIVVLPPYFFANATQAGLVGYFNTLAADIDVPLILYNFPLHTNNPLTPEVLKQVKHFGLKDSSASLELREVTPHYYIGGDCHILKSHQAGGCGFVSGPSNAFPVLFTAMESALAEGDTARAENIQKRICAVSEVFSGAGEISGIKYALSRVIKGYPTRVRLPLVPISRQQEKMVEDVLLEES
jgi:dihydrodipicolinate synthase/N-acetylneuraminate lyase/uridine kinase